MAECPLWLKRISYTVWIRDSMDLFAIWVCVQSNVLCLLLFMCLMCAMAAHTFYRDWFELQCFYHVCIKHDENVWIYFSSLMSSFLNRSHKCNMSDYSKITVHWTLNLKTMFLQRYENGHMQCMSHTESVLQKYSVWLSFAFNLVLTGCWLCPPHEENVFRVCDKAKLLPNAVQYCKIL